MIGLERGKTALFDHNPEWDKEAQRTIDLLKSILGDVAKNIQHIGSTAIKTIKAKPIIDIAVAVSDFADILCRNYELKAHGFYYRHAVDNTENILHGEIDYAAIDVRQLLYACGGFYDGLSKIQTHFIHVVKADSTEWYNYINFRDYLNIDPLVAKEYENLKIKLSVEYADNRAEYTAHKHDFIKSIFHKAAYMLETKSPKSKNKNSF